MLTNSMRRGHCLSPGRTPLSPKSNVRKKLDSTDTLWRAVGDICSLFEPRECWNFLRHAGYAPD